MKVRPYGRLIQAIESDAHFLYPFQEEVLNGLYRMIEKPAAIKTILDSLQITADKNAVLVSAPVKKQRAIKRYYGPTPMDFFQAMQAGMRKKKNLDRHKQKQVEEMSVIDSALPTGELTYKGKELYTRIKQILELQFVNYDRVAYTMALALSCNQNCWFYGHGGYGKSTMIEAIMRGLDLGPELYIQSFGQGMTPEKLVGNLDLKALNEENLMRFNVAESFMAKKYAIFEEMPDAAINVLFMLKDTLERRIFRDGAQQYPIRTQSIIVLSNRSPKTVAEYGVDADALTQRFPFRESVEWETHTPDCYDKLFIKREAGLGGPNFSESIRKSLAQILGDAASRGEPIPPRIALHAVSAIKAAATVRGASSCGSEDFIALRHVAGLETLGANVEREVAAAAQRAEADGRLKVAEAAGAMLFSELANATTPIKALQVMKKFKSYVAETVTTLKVTDELAVRKDDLVQKCNKAIQIALDKAIELTV